ncbi:MAG: MBL fold metallo-hydrolase [Ignavibacteriae bacterium]|jgi:phosphoribosyl 1,2-cyclic phosphodiesterase|nr:MBL fold metallo-hydrolase [Ignavibacteriota bacterium]NOG96578.1 MBL fold metallo-hydrolase [Ignavibacteriota bacterium]
MVLKIWGTRGSVPVPGEGTKKYGGNTPCIEVISGSDEEAIIVDAGTGIRELGNKITENPNDFKRINILLSHTHWDHIQGMPFFAPLYNEKFVVDIYSYSYNGYGLDHFIDAQMRPEFFPVNKAIFKANVTYKKLIKNEDIQLGGVQISSVATHHSRGTLAFRLNKNGKSIVYMTDNEVLYNEENGQPKLEDVLNRNKELLKFCSGCDYLIHDTMYKLDDFSDKMGWGHSNNIAAALFASAAKAKNLILFHYSPEYNDEKIDELFHETEKFIAVNNLDINCLPSHEGLEIKL